MDLVVPVTTRSESLIQALALPTVFTREKVGSPCFCVLAWLVPVYIRISVVPTKYTELTEMCIVNEFETLTRFDRQVIQRSASCGMFVIVRIQSHCQTYTRRHTARFSDAPPTTILTQRP